MNTIGRALGTVICCAIYAFVGLTLGIASGFIVTKLIEGLSGASLVFTMTGQILVAIWAIMLAVLAVWTYLRFPRR